MKTDKNRVRQRSFPRRTSHRTVTRLLIDRRRRRNSLFMLRLTSIHRRSPTMVARARRLLGTASQQRNCEKESYVPDSLNWFPWHPLVGESNHHAGRITIAKPNERSKKERERGREEEREKEPSCERSKDHLIWRFASGPNNKKPSQQHFSLARNHGCLAQGAYRPILSLQVKIVFVFSRCVLHWQFTSSARWSAVTSGDQRCHSALCLHIFIT